jgi:hypothetical protein
MPVSMKLATVNSSNKNKHAKQKAAEERYFGALLHSSEISVQVSQFFFQVFFRARNHVFFLWLVKKKS